MLDSILPFGPTSGGPSAGVRLGVGVGLERPWDAALALLAAAPPSQRACGPAAGPENVRLTVGPVRYDSGRLVAARIGLLESHGRAGEARIKWRDRVARAVVCDAAGRVLPAGSGAGAVVVDGRVTTVFLRRYEWLHLDLEFSP
jgi:hypothetical protein